MLALTAWPVSATVIERGPYSGTYAFSYDCDFSKINVQGEFGGTASIRVGKGSKATAFFAHDNYWFREVHTAAATQTWVMVSGNGLFQETKATPMGGSIFTFTSVNAGQPFVVTSSAGDILLRDRGAIRETILFDTGGDAVPGGTFLGSLSFDVHGPHPGLDVDLCDFLETE